MFLSGSPARFWPQFLPSCLLAASNLSLLMEGQCPLFALPSPFHPTPIHDVLLYPTMLTYITIWGESVFKVLNDVWNWNYSSYWINPPVCCSLDKYFPHVEKLSWGGRREGVESAPRNVSHLFWSSSRKSTQRSSWQNKWKNAIASSTDSQEF